MPVPILRTSQRGITGVARRRTLSGPAALALLAVATALPGSVLAQQRPPQPAPAPAPLPLPPQHSLLGELRAKELRLDAMRLLTDPANYSRQYQRTLEFARCVGRVSPKRIDGLLVQPVSSKGEQRAVRGMLRFAPGCLGQDFQVSSLMLRGAAAEAALANFSVPEPARTGEVDSDRVLAFLASTPDADGKAEARMQTLIECQVMIAPGLARDLLESAPGSAEEKPATAALGEATKACGALEIGNAYFGMIYRSHLAETLYHWVHSKPGALPKSARAATRDGSTADA